MVMVSVMMTVPILVTCGVGEGDILVMRGVRASNLEGAMGGVGEF